MERTIAIASNLIPLGGILLLGWSAAPALLLIWIDLVRSGFLAFVVLASLFTIYVELHENWLGTLLRRIQACRLPR